MSDETLEGFGDAVVWSDEAAGVVTLAVRGSLDLVLRPEVDAALDRLAAEPAREVTIDLAEVRFFGIDGCRLVAGALGAVGPDGRVRLRNVGSFERYLLTIAGLLGAVEVDGAGPDRPDPGRVA